MAMLTSCASQSIDGGYCPWGMRWRQQYPQQEWEVHSTNGWHWQAFVKALGTESHLSCFALSRAFGTVSFLKGRNHTFEIYFRPRGLNQTEAVTWAIYVK